MDFSPEQEVQIPLAVMILLASSILSTMHSEHDPDEFLYCPFLQSLVSYYLQTNPPSAFLEGTNPSLQIQISSMGIEF